MSQLSPASPRPMNSNRRKGSERPSSSMVATSCSLETTRPSCSPTVDRALSAETEVSLGGRGAVTTLSLAWLWVFVVAVPGCAIFRVAPGKTVLPACTAGPPPGEAWSIYFPKGRFGESDELTQHWYGKHLASMKEPSLSCSRPATSEAYRFVWLRSFHEPWAIRVERTATGAHLFAVETDGRGGYGAGRPSDTIARALDGSGWNNLAVCIQSADFWRMPLDEERTGADGAEWIVEGLRDGEYRVISRWSPGSGSFYDLGRCFIRLAGLEDVAPVY
jgi:hypothetical protein